MTGEYLGGLLAPFDCPPSGDPRKRQRVKLTEEAAEAFAAAQSAADWEDVDPSDMGHDWTPVLDYELVCLADELADVIQAAVNLAAVHGIDDVMLTRALRRCRECNRERGRC